MKPTITGRGLLTEMLSAMVGRLLEQDAQIDQLTAEARKVEPLQQRVAEFESNYVHEQNLLEEQDRAAGLDSELHDARAKLGLMSADLEAAEEKLKATASLLELSRFRVDDVERAKRHVLAERDEARNDRDSLGKRLGEEVKLRMFYQESLKDTNARVDRLEKEVEEANRGRDKAWMEVEHYKGLALSVGVLKPWNAAKPTEPGWYWFKPLDDEEDACVVEIVQTGAGLIEKISGILLTDSRSDGLWSARLPTPMFE